MIIETEKIIPDEKDEKNISLFERSNILHQAIGYLDEETTDQEFDLIAETEQDFQHKLIACGYVAKKYTNANAIIKSEIQSLKDQIELLENRARVFENKSSLRKEAMKEAMLLNNLKKVGCETFTVSLRAKPQKAVAIEGKADIAIMSDKYVRVKKDFNKTEILKDLKSGDKIHGWELSQPDFSISIK